MKNKKKRKGFTLVELLVVIAILAVLATVAILGYTQFTKKANIANDQAICSQMNLALQSNEALDNKARYAHQAVGQCQDAGFILENLTPSTADFHFAYDQKYNRFMLLEKDFSFNYGDTQHSKVEPDSIENVNVFVVVGNEKELKDANDAGFSTYLRKEFAFTESNANHALNTDKGIDVGACLDVASIVYDNSEASEGQEVVIRTNGGKLTVNAPNDHMEHFGTLDFLQINAIKTTASYVENGYTAQGQIKEGRVVNTKGTIEVDGETKATGVANLFIETNAAGNGFGTVVVASQDGADLPTLDRGEVTIGDGVLVVEVQELIGETKTSDEFIWLFGNGTVEAEKVVVTASASKPATDTGVLNTATKSGKAGEEIANIARKNADGTKYLKADGSETDNPAEAGTEAKASKTDVEKGTSLFAGGAGTENSPYLISNASQFKQIGKNSKDVHYKLINDIHYTKSSDFTNSSVSGHRLGIVYAENAIIDGDNHSIDLFDSSNTYSMYLIYSSTNVKFKNIEFIYTPDSCVMSIYLKGDILFENITTSGESEWGNNSGLYAQEVGATGTKTNVTFKNCINNASFSAPGVSQAYNGLLLGRSWGSVNVTIDGFVNNAKVVGGETAVVFGSANYSKNSDILTFNIKDFVNNGEIRSLIVDNYTPNMFAAAGLYAIQYKITLNDEVVLDKKLSSNIATELSKIRFASNFIQGPNDSKLALVENANKTFTGTKSENASATRYEIAFTFYCTPDEDRTGSLAVVYTEELDSSLVSKMHNYRFTDNSNGACIDTGVVENGFKVYKNNSTGEYFYLFEKEGYSLNGINKQADILIIAYDANGKTIASACLTK